MMKAVETTDVEWEECRAKSFLHFFVGTPYVCIGWFVPDGPVRDPNCGRGIFSTSMYGWTACHLSSTAAAAAGAAGVFRGTHPDIEFGWCTEEPSSLTRSQRPVVIFFCSMLVLISTDTVQTHSFHHAHDVVDGILLF